MTGPQRGAAMAAEMAEQPVVLERLLARRAGIEAAVAERPAGFALVARGSSDHAAAYGRYLLETATGRPVSLIAPSLHTLYRIDADYRGWIVVAVSQSGRTPEIVATARRLGRAGARTVAMTNDAASPLAAAVDAVVDLGAGDELAVPATKTVTATMLAMVLLGAAAGRVPLSADELERLPAHVADVLGDPRPAREAAGVLAGADHLVVAARGYLYPAALECALKIRETTGVAAEAYSTADLRHGPIAAVGRGDHALTLAVRGPAAADVERLAGELTGRGARVLRLGDAPGADLPLAEELPELLAPIAAVVRGQQLAHALALQGGTDPDAPGGLSKVTVT
jgi:glucosamine--fructose-6-phosphate aminotransferase (isomerizing)